MEDTFYYAGITEEVIGNNKFLCIRILDYEKFAPIKIYKNFTEELKDTIFTQFDLFENITDKITFDIKRDNKTNKTKIVLDIKI